MRSSVPRVPVTSAVVLSASVHIHRKCPADPAAGLVVLCHSAPEPTNETLQTEVQAQLGISRIRLGGC
jgi:hypothetical protein